MKATSSDAPWKSGRGGPAGRGAARAARPAGAPRPAAARAARPRRRAQLDQAAEALQAVAGALARASPAPCGAGWSGACPRRRAGRPRPPAACGRRHQRHAGEAVRRRCASGSVRRSSSGAGGVEPGPRTSSWFSSWRRRAHGPGGARAASSGAARPRAGTSLHAEARRGLSVAGRQVGDDQLAVLSDAQRREPMTPAGSSDSGAWRAGRASRCRRRPRSASCRGVQPERVDVAAAGSTMTAAGALALGRQARGAQRVADALGGQHVGRGQAAIHAHAQPGSDARIEMTTSSSSSVTRAPRSVARARSIS